MERLNYCHGGRQGLRNAMMAQSEQCMLRCSISVIAIKYLTKGTGAHVSCHGDSDNYALFVFLFLGLAVHQIITITVSLIMIVAALITTLVLKNW